HDQRVVQQVAITVRGFLQPLQEVWYQADVILVDLGEVEDLVLILAMMRSRVKARADASFGIDATRHVAPHLEGANARRIRREGERLQVEHQLDVLPEGVRNADWCFGYLPRLTAGVV